MVECTKWINNYKHMTEERGDLTFEVLCFMSEHTKISNTRMLLFLTDFTRQ